MGIKEDILEYCSSLGLDTVGFIKCRKFEELKDFYEDRKLKGLENKLKKRV